MRVPTGSLGLTVVVAAVALLGAAVEAGVEDVASSENVASSEGGFRSHTLFCPPPASRTGQGEEVLDAASGIVWATGGEEPSRVGFEPQADDPRDLPANSTIERDAPEGAVDVVGYGAPLGASVTQWIGEPPLGVGAAACSSTASGTWYFAQGSSLNGIFEQLVLYNPFPDAAAVRVTTYRPGGDQNPALLSKLQVAEGQTEIVDLSESLGPESGELGVRISASRGRFVAWRSMTVEVEGRPSGYELSLGATEPSQTWYFPDGADGEDVRTSLVLVNPNEEAARVDLALLTARRPVVPPGLEGIAIPPTSARSVSLEEALEGQEIPATFGLAIDASRPIVAERAISSDTLGRSAEVGAGSGAPLWYAPPLAPKTENDRLLVMNPGSERVTLTVTLARTDGDAFSPQRLNVGIEGNRRVELGLRNWAGRAPFSALVSASGPIVVERAGYAQGRRDLVSAVAVPIAAEAGS